MGHSSPGRTMKWTQIFCHYQKAVREF
uniref:Uncharacterized protein n=1 Tax=Anguilla anguilla TaxID=7936 RepID=A0A0E9UUK0_ANGAN